MRKVRATYMVACRAESGSHYVLATRRQFHKYSDAELFMLGVAASRQPIIIVID